MGLAPARLVLLIKERILEVARQLGQEFCLVRFPEEMRRIEEGGLEEEHKIDPLIILVINSLLVIMAKLVDARMSDLMIWFVRDLI